MIKLAVRRPFFLFAIILVVVILVFKPAVKKIKFHDDHITNLIPPATVRAAINGVVISDPYFKMHQFGTSQVFIVRPRRIKLYQRWHDTYGDVLVKSKSGTFVKYGDEVLFEASIKIPKSVEEDDFDYAAYLESRGVYAMGTISQGDQITVSGNEGFVVKRVMYDLKDALGKRIEGLFRAPERHLIAAIVIGERQNMPREWIDNFFNTQTMHLLAISGLHIGIIALVLAMVFSGIGLHRNLRNLIVIMLLVFYAVMIGGRSSVVRATIMGIAILGAQILSRQADLYNSLGLAASGILLYNPEQLYDKGFILSFAAVLSIIYMTPRINYILRFTKIDRKKAMGRFGYKVCTLISASIAVWIGLLPFTVNFFNVVSPVSVFVNLLAIPLLFVVLAFSMAAMLFQALVPFLGGVFASATEFSVALLLNIINFFAKLPLACFEVRPVPRYAVAVYFLVLIIVLEWGSIKSIFAKYAHYERK